MDDLKRILELAGVLRENDEDGPNFVWRNGDYAIAVNDPENATYVTAWYNGKKVGYLSTRNHSSSEPGYLGIGSARVDQKHQKNRLGITMYRMLLKHLHPKWKGIVSYLPDRSNKKAIPKIYQRLGGWTNNGDYAYIDRPTDLNEDTSPAIADRTKLITKGEMFEHYGIDQDEWWEFSEDSIRWINRNVKQPIDRAIKKPNLVLASKIALHYYLHAVFNQREKFSSIGAFEKALNEPITLWRGGGFEYNADRTKKWASFTANKQLLQRFSVYHGTHATSNQFLSKRSQYWEVELTIKLDDIKLYLTAGLDEEVIVPEHLAKQAKVITQTEKPDWAELAKRAMTGDV